MQHYVDIPEVMASSRSGIEMNTYINIRESRKLTQISKDKVEVKFTFFSTKLFQVPVPVAARSKA